MTWTGVVLRLDGECENFHPSLTSHTRHTRHTGHTAVNPQVRAPGNDFAGALGARSTEGSSQRVYLLDIGKNAVDGNIAINIEVCCGVQFAERVAAAAPIIKSFAFKVD
jgi:hypothetical protein